MNPANFLTELKIEDIAEGRDTRLFRLEEDFRVYSGVLDAIINVPTGFICDGESIPAFLQFLVPPFGLSKRAAICHDYLYRNRGYYDSDNVFHPVTRTQADAVYRELCLAKGLPAWRTATRWTVLRLVGWKAWNDDARLTKLPTANAAIWICASFLTACSLTPEQRATLEANALKDAAAAAQGGLTTGTWQGAALAAGAQVIRNHTATKNPVKVTP